MSEDVVEQITEHLRSVGAKLEAGVALMHTLHEQNAELREIVSKLGQVVINQQVQIETSKEKISKLSTVAREGDEVILHYFRDVEERVIALEARLPQDRGIGRSP
jgi:hypothetical protein